MATSSLGVVVSWQFWPIAQECRSRARAPIVGDRGCVLAGCLPTLDPDGLSRPAGVFVIRSANTGSQGPQRRETSSSSTNLWQARDLRYALAAPNSFSQWVCFDPASDREGALDLVKHFSTAFLLDTLKGDAAAAAALSPQNVRFQGIKYETTALP